MTVWVRQGVLLALLVTSAVAAQEEQKSRPVTDVPLTKQTNIDDELAEYAQPYDGRPAPDRAFKVRRNGDAKHASARKVTNR